MKLIKVKIALPVLIVALLVGVALFFWKTMSAPAVGSIKNNGILRPADKTFAKKTGTYNGKTISFSYPTEYEIVASPQNTGYIEVVNLFSTDHTNTHLAVTVVREALANDPGLHLRQSRPDIYKQISSSPAGALFTSSQNGNEETEYTAQSGLVTSISLTVPGPKDISQDFATIVNSLKWQQ